MGLFSHEDLVTIQCDPGMVTSGDVINGFVEVNLRLAKDKEVKKIAIGLHGKLRTCIKKEEGEARLTYSENQDLARIDQPLWEAPAALYPDPSSPNGNHARIPFQFVMPRGNLPPSFHMNGSQIGREYEGSIVYYLHVKASREGWYHRDGRVDLPFAYVPTDRFDPRTPLSLQGYNGNWQAYAADEDLKKHLFSHHGHGHVEVQVPALPQFPLFIPIPIRVRIICTSKPLKADELSEFDFPRMPELKRVALTIRQQCRVSARGVFVHDKESETDKTPIPGFGKLAEDTNAVSIAKSEPTWQPESPGNPKGRFSEDIVISSWVTFQSPPPFETEFLSEWIFLDLVVDFPGMGHNVKVLTPALNIQAPPKQPPAPPPSWNGFQGTLQLPPNYWNYASNEEQ